MSDDISAAEQAKSTDHPATINPQATYRDGRDDGDASSSSPTKRVKLNNSPPTETLLAAPAPALQRINSSDGFCEYLEFAARNL